MKKFLSLITLLNFLVPPVFADGNIDHPNNRRPDLDSRFWYLPNFEIGPISNELPTSIGLNAYYLANLSESDYMSFQAANLHNKTHACNLFVYTVLYSLGIARLTEVPYALANFMSRKLKHSNQFKEISFDDLDQESQDPNYVWNVIMTHSEWPKHGHTVIPIGRVLDKDGNIAPKGSVIIAEGQYHQSSHVLKSYSLNYIKKRQFRFFQYIPNTEDEKNTPEPTEEKKSFFKHFFKHRKEVIQAPVEPQDDSTEVKDPVPDDQSGTSPKKTTEDSDQK